MFWEKDPPSHNIEILLESPDTKLEVFLEEDNIIQECKTHKKNIVNYFTRPDVIRRMIELVTTEPPEEAPINERFRHANVACEILTMGLPSLDEKLLADTDTLNLLYSYLENEPPLNPLLASFFSKTFGMLFIKKSDKDWFLYQQTCLKLLEYLKTKNNFLDLICKHFTTPIVPDLIMEMMQNVEGAQLKKSLFEWLNEERLVEKLIEIIGDPEQSEKHTNVADFLCDLIHQGRTMRQDIDSFEPVFEGSDPILQKLESATTLLALFNVILQPNTVESAIISGITVVLKIIRPTKPTDDRNMERMLCFETREKKIHDEFLTTVIRVIEPQIKYFNDMLKTPPKKSDIITSAATMSPPFGMARLQIVRLFAELLETKNDEISNAICKTDFLDTLLALFKEYCWNNFLHSEVEKCIHSIFPYSYQPPKAKTNNNAAETNEGNKDEKEGLTNFDSGDLLPKEQETAESATPAQSSPFDIQIHAIVNCQIISKLIECWKINKETESAENGRRLGFMGHLINIFKHITKCVSESEHIGALIENNLKDDNERNLWQSIVNPTDGELTVALNAQSKLLADHEPCEYNVSLDFFNDNNLLDAFNGLCTLMDSSDADVIFTLDYNTQQDDHDFDDDDGDDDYNNIDNDNNEGRDKDQRNDDVKNALNLFQFGRNNDDDEADEDDNASAPFDSDGSLTFKVEKPEKDPRVAPFDRNPLLDYIINPADFCAQKTDLTNSSPELVAYAELMAYFTGQGTASASATANATAPTQETNASENSSKEYDNNANVEKLSSWSGDFAAFKIPKKDPQFTSSFVDDYEDDEGMWTKPLGGSASTSSANKTHTLFNQEDQFEADFLTNGPSLLQESQPTLEESPLNQLNKSNEDNTAVGQPAEEITSNENEDDLGKETNTEAATSKHKSDTNEKEIKTDNTTTNTPPNEQTNEAASKADLSDESTASTTTT